MKNLKKIIIFSFSILLFFIAILFTLNSFSKKEDFSKIYYEIKNFNLNSIKVSKKDEESYVILNNKIVGLEKIPLNEGLINELFNFLSKIEVERIFTPLEDLVEYGLKKPEFVFEVETEEEKFNLEVGKKSLDGLGYYIKVKGEKVKDEKIAIVNFSKIEKFLINKVGYVNLNLKPTYETTFGEDGKYNGDGLQKCKIERKDLKEPLEFKVNEKGEIVIAFPSSFNLTDEIKKTIERSAYLLRAQEVYKVNPTEKEIKECGFKNSTAIVSYVIDDKKYVIRIGGVAKVKDKPKFEEEEQNNLTKYYYVMLDGVDVIYILDEESLPWLKI